MTEPDRLARNTTRLMDCNPVFALRVSRIIAGLEAVGYRPRIQDAFRDPDAQAAAVASGHSQVSWSFHMALTPEGAPDALAVDLLDDNNPVVPPTNYLIRLAAMASRHLCETGILWGLAPALKIKLHDAISEGNWTLITPIGWDPTHVQPVDVTIAQARRGIRPTV
jgi:hypothetical protein